MYKQLHLQRVKKGLVVSALLSSFISFGMDNPAETHELHNGAVFSDANQRSAIKQVKDDITTRVQELLAQGFSGYWNKVDILNDLERENSADEDKNEVILQSALSHEVNNEPIQKVHVSWLGAYGKKLGFGALALVTMSGTTYVLYKNGTLKKLEDVMKKHAYISAGLLTATAFLIGRVGLLALVDNGFLSDRVGFLLRPSFIRQ